jgi:hypothetical protein
MRHPKYFLPDFIPSVIAFHLLRTSLSMMQVPMPSSFMGQPHLDVQCGRLSTNHTKIAPSTVWCNTALQNQLQNSSTLLQIFQHLLAKFQNLLCNVGTDSVCVFLGHYGNSWAGVDACSATGTNAIFFQHACVPRGLTPRTDNETKADKKTCREALVYAEETTRKQSAFFRSSCTLFWYMYI